MNFSGFPGVAVLSYCSAISSFSPAGDLLCQQIRPGRDGVHRRKQLSLETRIWRRIWGHSNKPLVEARGREKMSLENAGGWG